MFTKNLPLTILLVTICSCNEGGQSTANSDDSAVNIDKSDSLVETKDDTSQATKEEDYFNELAKEGGELGLSNNTSCQPGSYGQLFTYNVDWLFYTTGKNRSQLNVSRKNTQMNALINAYSHEDKSQIYVTKAYAKIFSNKYVMPVLAPNDLISYYFRGNVLSKAFNRAIVGNQSYESGLKFAGLPVTKGTRAYVYPYPDQEGPKSTYFTYFYDVKGYEKTNIKGQFVQVTCTSKEAKPLCDNEGTDVKQIRYTLAKVSCGTINPIPTAKNFAQGEYTDSEKRRYTFSNGNVSRGWLITSDNLTNVHTSISLDSSGTQRVKSFGANLKNIDFAALREGAHKHSDFRLSVAIDSWQNRFHASSQVNKNSCNITIKNTYFGKSFTTLCDTYSTVWKPIWKQYIVKFKINGELNTTETDQNLSSERAF